MINGKAFYKMSYGLYIVSTAYDSKLNGQIANTFFQVTSEPPMVAVSINKQNLTHEYIKKSGVLSVSVLSEETSMDFIGKFGFKSGREIDKFSGIAYKTGESNVPIVIDNAVSYFELKVENEIDVFTHTIFICRVLNSEVLKDMNAMTYKYYHDIKHGKSPKTAPTYLNILDDFLDINVKTGKYQCSICGYIYDTSAGVQNSGIPAETPFEELPNDWICPICKAPKDKFKKV